MKGGSATMHSVFVDLGFMRIHWYGVMMAMGFLATLGNWIWLGRRKHRDAAFCSDLLFWVMIAGIGGARLAYVFENLSLYADSPLSVLAVWEGGLVFYGGFVGAALALVVISRVRGVPLPDLVDFTLTSVPLAHGIGRIGCFLNGCCFGKRCDHWMGVRFPALSAPWWAQQDLAHMPRQYELDALVAAMPRSLPVHPVQLYEAFGNVIIYVSVVWLYRRQRSPGWVTALYLVLYGSLRYVVEIFRGDRGERLDVGGFSIAQSLSGILILTGVVMFAVLYRRRHRMDAA
jgi:phosphatidylglycerol:prolipoprotein diacylglycerol transferase